AGVDAEQRVEIARRRVDLDLAVAGRGPRIPDARTCGGARNSGGLARLQRCAHTRIAQTGCGRPSQDGRVGEVVVRRRQRSRRRAAERDACPDRTEQRYAEPKLHRASRYSEATSQPRDMSASTASVMNAVAFGASANV